MSAESMVKIKQIVPGICKGKLLLLERYVSFFGEVDPESGCLREENICVSNVVLAFKGTRGSTVAPYIIYALKKNGKSPICMLVEEAEPMLIAGCVVAEIPLYAVEDLSKLRGFAGCHVKVVGDTLEVECSE
ncbi:MAG: aconitase X swivel domain-containing protein [Desulfurococcaceae archaeon]